MVKNYLKNLNSYKYLKFKCRFNLRKFQRYRLVFEYHDSSIFPPPINLISYMISFGKYLKRKNSRNEENLIKKQGLF